MSDDSQITDRIYDVVYQYRHLFEKFRGLSDTQVKQRLSRCPPLELLGDYDEIIKRNHYQPGPDFYLDTGNYIDRGPQDDLRY